MEPCANHLILRSELEDQIEVTQARVWDRTKTLAGLGVVFAGFLALGLAYGAPGHVGACVIALYALIPWTQRMMATDRLRRLGDELGRVERELENGALPRLHDRNQDRHREPPGAPVAWTG